MSRGTDSGFCKPLPEAFSPFHCVLGEVKIKKSIRKFSMNLGFGTSCALLEEQESIRDFARFDEHRA